MTRNQYMYYHKKNVVVMHSDFLTLLLSERQNSKLHWVLAILDAVRFNTVELQWLKHLWYHENMFETGVVRANEY